MPTPKQTLTPMPQPVIAGPGLFSMAIVNAGCTERGASHPPAAMPAHTPEAAAAQPPPAPTPGLVADTSPVSAPATPAGTQFSRWLEAFNSGNRETLLAYHEQHFPCSAASADVADIDREHGLSLGTNGFTERQVEQSTPTALTILLQERARPQFARVHLKVEPSAPHRVVQFEIGPIPKPPQFLSQEELAQRNVDAARRDAVIGALSRELEAHYIFEEVAQKMVARLSEKAAHGDYDTITDAAEFAQMLTADLNVALLTINGFVPLLGAAVEEAIGARMSEIADADAVIIDLRNNHGGWPETVAFIARAISSRPGRCC